jgi:glycerol-3-phosphate dehydrogenase
VFFVIPWMGKTLIGTTDTFTEESPDNLEVSAADVDYLLAGHNHYFEPVLRADELCGRFAGLRPLIHNHAGEPSSLSREYRLFSGPGGLLSVAGGKYTTYRHMAEEITDAVLRRLGRRAACRTKDYLLAGTPRAPWAAFAPAAVADLEMHYQLTPDAACHLVNRYGRRAADVAAYRGGAPELAEPVVVGEPDLKAELPYQRDHEMALFKADHLLRRTRLGLFRPDLLA